VTDSNHQNEGPKARGTDRRSFLTVAAAAAAVGAVAQPGLASGSTASGSARRRFVFLFEGRLLRQASCGAVEMETMNGILVKVDGRDLALAEQVQDPNTGRTFIRILIKEEAEVEIDADQELIRWIPKMADNVMAAELPLVFASRSGLAKNAVAQAFTLRDMEQVEVPGPDGSIETILLAPLMFSGEDVTVCAMTCRTTCHPLGWNDDTIGEVGRVDDWPVDGE
jgi:hypothetical protein